MKNALGEFKEAPVPTTNSPLGEYGGYGLCAIRFFGIQCWRCAEVAADVPLWLTMMKCVRIIVECTAHWENFPQDIQRKAGTAVRWGRNVGHHSVFILFCWSQLQSNS